MMEALLIKIH
uniref:Uncharacterized protein n=1 Tax=Anguilla anguilla TaxID=7936 RepID=A0A0E9XY03_ANGAN